MWDLDFLMSSEKKSLLGWKLLATVKCMIIRMFFYVIGQNVRKIFSLRK